MSISHAPRPTETPVSREEVSFLSGRQRCDGWLFRPAGGGAHPCVVMAHGIGGIRSAVLPEIAMRFAEAGFAALVFDYRHLGTSEGHPRGLIDVAKQREDYRAASAHVRELDGIDPYRIALWGTSFSGGHVLSLAAEDTKDTEGTGHPGIAAAVIQNPFVDGRASVAATIRSAGRVRTTRLVGKGLRDEARRLLRREPYRVDLAGPPGSVALMTTPDAVPGYRSLLPADPTDRAGWEPAVPARIVLRLGSERPARRAHRVKCPLLVSVCDHDAISPPAAAVRVAERAPRGELRRYPIGHFDLFTNPWRDLVVNDQIDFLRRSLLTGQR